MGNTRDVAATDTQVWGIIEHCCASLQTSSGAEVGSGLTFPRFIPETTSELQFFPAADPPGPCRTVEADQGITLDPIALPQHNSGGNGNQSAQSKGANHRAGASCGTSAGGGSNSSLSMLSDTTLAGYSWEYGHQMSGATGRTLATCRWWHTV